MDISNIRQYLSDDMQKVEELIEASLQSDISLLNATNRSILSHGGKKIRPIMALLIAKACSGGHVKDDTLRFAAASELLHNATLLHDDVADDSPNRRGMPTVMSILGGRASVLLGDYWLVKAVDRILQADLNGNEIIRLFAKTLRDLAEGEMLQLEKAKECDADEADYYRIIHSKTASLFEAACISAAISVGASEEKIRAAKSYATNIGIAFQIKDDIFDYQADAAIGKPVGIDLREQKITLPLLGALYSAPKEEELEIRKKLKEIQKYPANLDEIVAFVNKYGGTAYAEKKLNEFVDKAVIALRALPESKDKEYLKMLADFVAVRKI